LENSQQEASSKRLRRRRAPAMFPSFLCGNYSENNTSADAALERLLSSYKKLIVEGGFVDTKTETGFNATAVFLESLEAAARSLRLDPASRSYRSSFTINYRALFPDESRNYRVDILEASIEQNAVIWVNGDKFEFSQEAMQCAEDLQRGWSDMCLLLDRWQGGGKHDRPEKTEVRTGLVTLDVAWAAFEKKYISELIQIEDQARKLIVQAVESERRLRDLEACHGETEALLARADYQAEQRKLVGSISYLNSVANFRRKGRDDLPADVLFDAVRTIQRCDAAERNGQSTELSAAARTLCGDVVESFVAMRFYLREIGKCLERVDPHLCNNAGLVTRLVDWEESWEVGARYVQNEQLLNGICDLVAEIRMAQHVAPNLRTMCEECDVDLFLVMPRVIWLRGLIKPQGQVQVFKSLLPHRFLDPPVIGDVWNVDTELAGFVELFKTVYLTLMSNWRSAARVSERAAWEILVKRVVNGDSEADKEDIYGILATGVRAQSEAAVEDLVNKMEGWSMELQRHCAEDWNQFAGILIQCLSGERKKDASQVQFQV